MSSNANITVGKGWFGGKRSDIVSIIINSGETPIDSTGLIEYSLEFNKVPVYNTIGTTTYKLQSSNVSGIGTCVLYSGIDGGYCK